LRSDREEKEIKINIRQYSAVVIGSFREYSAGEK
jgi:hypothetical protein